jgi:dTDP-4-amino-4,6-dideoxygalactose transaminase
LVERAEILREKGTNRTKFFRGQVDKYTWVDLGSSYVMSDVLAAFLFGQLESWEKTQAKRRAIWRTYDRELKDWAVINKVRKPVVPSYCDQSWHMYYLLMPTSKARMKFITKLKEVGVTAVFHYLPLHRSLFAKKRELGAWSKKQQAVCPVAERVSEKIVRLPYFTSMKEEIQLKVIKEILKIKL